VITITRIQRGSQRPSVLDLVASAYGRLTSLARATNTSPSPALASMSMPRASLPMMPWLLVAPHQSHGMAVLGV